MLTICAAHIAVIRAELDSRNLSRFNKTDGQDRAAMNVNVSDLGKNRSDPLLVVQEKILKIGFKKMPLQAISQTKTYCPCCEARKEFDETWDDPNVLVPWDTELIRSAANAVQDAMRRQGYV